MSRGRPRIKRAVIVGINKYQHSENIDLNGCVMDAIDFYQQLRWFYGYRGYHCKLLLNEDATKDNILDALDWAVRRTKARQEVTYFHSGHGSQVADLNGDESDHLDEVIIPNDFNGSNVINDDELYSVFQNLDPLGYLNMVCDTCYSGGTNKGVGSKTISMGYVDKTLPVSHYGVKDVDKTTQRHVLLSACREGEYSQEAYLGKWGWRGIFSFFLCRHLYNYRRMNLSWVDIYSSIYGKVKGNGFTQNPIVVGSRSLLDRTVVGGRQ
jgi:hypothetical protein